MKEKIESMAVTFKKAGLVTAFVAANALMANVASAGSIPIVNHSFEDPDIALGITVGDHPGWAFGRSGVAGDTFTAAGIYDLSVSNGVGPLAFPGGAPDGENSLYVYSDGEVGSGELWASQTLMTNLQSYSRYILEVEVGDPADDGYGVGGGFPGYRIELLAGGVVLAQDMDTLTLVEGGSFQTSRIGFTSGNVAPGQALEIRLVNTLTGAGLEVDFDDVRLTVPEPATLALFGLGLAGLGAMRRKATSND